MLALRGRRPA